MDTIARNVSQLASADRAALEHVIGRPLQPDQQILIAVLRSGERLDLSREAARARLLKLLQRTSQHAAATGVTSDNADAIVAEAMAAVRPRGQ